MKTNKTIMVRWAIALICICGLSAEGWCECLSEPAREIKEELSSIIRRDCSPSEPEIVAHLFKLYAEMAKEVK